MTKIKKIVSLMVTMVLLCVACFAISAYGDSDEGTEAGNSGIKVTENAATTTPNYAPITIVMQLNSEWMEVNGEQSRIDEGGAVPVISNGRTLLPVRAIVEAIGGSVDWNNDSRTSTLEHNGNIIVLQIDSLTATLNGVERTLDTAPVIINGRTMLPIRFIAEGFGFAVEWNEEEQTITVSNVQQENTKEGTEAMDNNQEKPTVYMSTDISSDTLMKIYQALDKEASGNVAVKLSTGEPGGHNFLSADLIKELVQSVDGTIVECNTAYGGARAATATHLQAAEDHGFTAIAEVDIMDADGSLSIPVIGGEHLSENFVGAHLSDYDSIMVLSHFKGHAMGGFGGAIKNISIGIASSEGKSWIHSAGSSRTNPWGGDQDDFLESMAEAAKSVSDYTEGRMVYINVMNNLSVDCDCDSHPADPTMADIGILASTDPVALDQACVDLVYAADDGADLIERIESRNGLLTLEHAEKIGLGSRSYTLISLD